MQFLFLNNALNDFLNAIQNVWSPFLQMEGVKILLALSFLAFFVHAIELVATEDIGQFLFGLTFTIISIAVLYAVFINSQAFAFAVRDEFQQLAQRMTGESPSALTPAGVMEQGLRLVRIFWLLQSTDLGARNHDRFNHRGDRVRHRVNHLPTGVD